MENESMSTMLIINISPDLEDDLVDYLLGNSDVNGFTSFEVRGHGENVGMSIAEQVSGRRKRLHFEIMLKASSVSVLIAGLKSAVGSDIVYWQQKVFDLGRV